MAEVFSRKKEIQSFFGTVEHKGERKEIDLENFNPKNPELFYQHQNGELWMGDSIEWLRGLEENSVDLIFADPPYNIKKAEWDNFESHEKYIQWSMLWFEQAARVLKKNGTMYVCGFSETVADFSPECFQFFKGMRWIIWHYKNKANLGNDWGRSHESIIHLRKSKEFTFNIDAVRIPYSEHTLKYPSHPQAETSQYGKGKSSEHIWEPNPLGAKPKDVLEIPEDMIEIPTTCNGMHEKTPHPTQKPEELLRKLILVSSNAGDVIVDPFNGSGTTAVCAEQMQRKWKGCDLSHEYLGWAVARLELVEEWSIEKWIKYDFENLKRRNSIR